MLNTVKNSAEIEEQVADTISAAFTGLLPAVAEAVGPMPDLAGSKKDQKQTLEIWRKRVVEVTSILVDDTIGTLREQARIAAGIAVLKAAFEQAKAEGNKDLTTLRAIPLAVYTRGKNNSQGVLIAQNTFVPEEEWLKPAEAVKRAKAAVEAGDSDAFKSGFDSAPGPLGAVGIERMYIGLVDKPEFPIAFSSAHRAIGQLSKVYKEIVTTEPRDGKPSKKVRMCRYVEPIAEFAQSYTAQSDALDYFEEQANSAAAGDGDVDLDDFDKAPAAPAPAAATAWPQDENSFREWAQAQDFGKGVSAGEAMKQARAATGINKPIAAMTPSDFEAICEEMNAGLLV